MGKHSRLEEGQGNFTESRDNYKNRGKSRQSSSSGILSHHQGEKSGERLDESQRGISTRGNMERSVRKSKITDLLNSVKEDVIQMKENETLPSDDILTDSIHPGHNFQRSFTRVSPQKSNGGGSNNDSNHWRKAVQLSRVIIRPFQSISKVSRDFKGNESEDDTGEETSQNKMMGLLRTLDHCSCISSGILVGFLAINTVLWIYGLTKVSYTENFIRFYYSTTVVLTYTTLMGYLIRIYVSWQRVNAMLLVHIASFSSVLIFHYICKGYDLLRLECSTYYNNDDMRENIGNAFHCPDHHHNGTTTTMSSISQPEIIFILISRAVQTLGAIFIVFYFHFTPYVQSYTPTIPLP